MADIHRWLTYIDGPHTGMADIQRWLTYIDGPHMTGGGMSAKFLSVPQTWLIRSTGTAHSTDSHAVLLEEEGVKEGMTKITKGCLSLSSLSCSWSRPI